MAHVDEDNEKKNIIIRGKNYIKWIMICFLKI